MAGRTSASAIIGVDGGVVFFFTIFGAKESISPPMNADASGPHAASGKRASASVSSGSVR
jgi:hypothetical protein